MLQFVLSWYAIVRKHRFEAPYDDQNRTFTLAYCTEKAAANSEIGSMLPSISFHPALVHFPIAFFLLASGAAMLHLFATPRAELRLLVWVGTGLGLIGALGAILSGLFAQAGLPPDAPYRNVLNQHIGTGIAQALVYGWLLYRWRIFKLAIARTARRQPDQQPASNQGPTDLLDDPAARWWLGALFVLGALLVIASGWNGGRLVYEWGVNVGR
jgi:uncharacterized membrane protein